MSEKEKYTIGSDVVMLAFIASCGNATLKMFTDGGVGDWTLRGVFRDKNGHILPEYKMLVTINEIDCSDEFNAKEAVEFARNAVLEAYPNAVIDTVVEFDDNNEYFIVNEELYEEMQFWKKEKFIVDDQA